MSFADYFMVLVGIVGVAFVCFGIHCATSARRQESERRNLRGAALLWVDRQELDEPARARK